MDSDTVSRLSGVKKSGRMDYNNTIVMGSPNARVDAIYSQTTRADGYTLR